MSTNKKPAKAVNMEDMQKQLQDLIAKGKKEGMIRATELNALLEKMTLSAETIEDIYDKFEAMNIQVITGELDLDLGDDLDLDLGDDIDLTDKVAQGVAMGTAGHVIATSKANELDPLMGAVSSLSLVAAGLLTAAIYPMLVQLI